MVRTGLAALVIALAPAFGLGADEKEKKVVLYPLAKGHKWVYDLKVGGQTLAVTTELTEVVRSEKKDEATLYTLTTFINNDKIPEKLSEDDKGVYRHSTGKETFSSPVQIIKYPAKGGTKWDQKLTVADMEVKAEFEMKEAEEVAVPFGKYKAFPVVYKATVQGQTIEATTWYADGVGVVKLEIKTGGVTSTMELKAFTEGK